MNIYETMEDRKKRIDLAKSILYRLRYMIKNGLSEEDEEIVNSIYFESSYKIPLDISVLKRKEDYLEIEVPIKEHLKLTFRFELHPNFKIALNNINKKEEVELVQNNSFGYIRNKDFIRLSILFYINGEVEFTNYNYHQIMKDKELEEILVHEITHWFDEIRTKGKIKHSDKTNDIKDYYNSDDELNAYTQEIIKNIMDYLKDNKIKKENYKEEINKILKSNSFYIKYKDLLENLTSNNKKKLISRIFEFFVVHKNLLESISYSRIGDIKYYPIDIMKELYKNWLKCK